VALQLRLALNIYIEVAQLIHDTSEEKWGKLQLSKLDENLQKHAWDGEWFIRGYRPDGMKFGSRECPEGKIFLNPQVWSVISGAATGDQANASMDHVNKYLSTDYGLMLCDPPYTSTDYTIIRSQLFNPGLKENGGIFIHTQGWAVIAEAMLGRGNRAYQYLRSYLPAAFNSTAEIREIEPYVVCQSTHSKYSPGFGKSRIPWLSGSATWTYYAITQYILGIRPEYHGLRIDPCIPSQWKELNVQRIFRGKKFKITIQNEQGVEKGVKQVVLNGSEIQGNLIGLNDMLEKNEVLVMMG
ncbi:MAG TPA: glycosyl hydrolase family 65 protein, partial [Bacteroidales bacterium]|nr:glycosyl hydrolase family 65 protein [Bacteroidales bacterium]